jgi:hypothetical protein
MIPQQLALPPDVFTPLKQCGRTIFQTAAQPPRLF